MNVDWNAYTPGPALAGGALIGVAVSLFVLGNGAIAGISGVLGSALRGLQGGLGGREQRERWAFIAGLLVAPLVWRVFAAAPASRVDVGPVALIVAGLLVGVGTRLGGGCTSGHGVCGLARLSWRSVVATGLFMVAGFATVYLLRHGV